MKYKVGDKFQITKKRVGNPSEFSLFTITHIDNNGCTFHYHLPDDKKKIYTHYELHRDIKVGTFLYVNHIKTILPLP